MSGQDTSSAAPASPRDIEPGELCLDCGLCCTNAVFTHLEPTEHDKRRFLDNGLDELAGLDRIEFRCPMQDGAACSIYAVRPGVCRSWECKSLKRVRGGGLMLDDARVIVRKAVALYREFLALKPEDISYTEAQLAVARQSRPDAMSQAEFTRLGLAMMTLQTYLDKHIRDRGSEVIDSRPMQSARDD